MRFYGTTQHSPGFISKAVTGKGYRFIAPVVEVPAPLPERRRLSLERSRNRRAGDPPAAPAGPSAFPIQTPVSDDARSSGEKDARRFSLSGRWIWLTVAAALGCFVVAIGLGAQKFERSIAESRAAGPKISSLAVLPLDNLFRAIPGRITLRTV